MTESESACSRPHSQPSALNMSDNVKHELTKLRNLKLRLELKSDADPNLLAAEIQAAAEVEDTANAKFRGTTTSKNTFGGGVDRFGPINGRHPPSHAVVEKISLRTRPKDALLPPPPTKRTLGKSAAAPSTTSAPAAPHVCSRLYSDAQTRQYMQKRRAKESQSISAAKSHDDAKTPKTSTGVLDAFLMQWRTDCTKMLPKEDRGDGMLDLPRSTLSAMSRK